MSYIRSHIVDKRLTFPLSRGHTNRLGNEASVSLSHIIHPLLLTLPLLPLNPRCGHAEVPPRTSYKLSLCCFYFRSVFFVVYFCLQVSIHKHICSNTCYSTCLTSSPYSPIRAFWQWPKLGSAKCQNEEAAVMTLACLSLPGRTSYCDPDSTRHEHADADPQTYRGNSPFLSWICRHDRRCHESVLHV